MSFGFDGEEVTEGRARLIVPKVERPRGPGKKTWLPFYNRTMAFSRDVSIMAVQRLVSEGLHDLLDGLSATGARGVRIGKEVEGNFEVVLNDKSPVSSQLIQTNIEINELENALASQRDLRSLLAERKFDYIDIDPFGSPVPFLDSAFQAIKREGVVAVTATDTAVLCGSKKSACVRRYGSNPMAGKQCHEIGLRILIGYCVRSAARFGDAAWPILSFSKDHYFRVHLRVRKGAQKADECLQKVGYAYSNQKTLERGFTREKKDTQNAGPLWTGSLHDKGFLQELKSRDYFGSEVSKYLYLWRGEADSAGLSYTTEEIASFLNVDPPQIRFLIDCLADAGFSATRTHFSTTSFKTNASTEDIRRVLGLKKRTPR